MTHVLQPLDQTFSALKKRMQKLIHHWHGDPKNAGKRLDQYTLMKLVAYKAFEETFSRKETVQNAFRKTGLYPWNKIQPDVRKLKAGSIYRQNFVHEDVFPFPPGDSVPAPTATSDPVPAAVGHLPAAVHPPTATNAVPIPATVVSGSVDALFAPPPDSDIVPEASFIADYAEPAASVPGPSTSSSKSGSTSEPMSRETSSSSTATLPSSSTSTVDILLEKQSLLTFRQKEKQLEKLQATLDDEDVERFEELYSKGMFDVPHSMFQSWLILKKQAVGTEQEALDRVLSSRIPRNIPKKKTSRTNDMPKGDARYAPQHQEFYDYFGRCAERAKGKRKVTATATSADPPPLASKPPAAKRQRKTKPS